MPTSDLLIPVRRCKRQRGRFTWPKTAVLATPHEADLLPLGQLSADLARLGVRSRIVRNAYGPASVRIVRDKTVGAPEGYRLTVASDGIRIASATDAGAYYGVQTLRELLVAHGLALAACEIDDAPDFGRRGVYLDCSRGKVPTVETLKGLVERLAHWKVNELQPYVENVFTFRRHPAIGRGYSPFTPEELLEVQDLCRRHHMRFVGSLTSFGHFERILALPAYSHLGEMPGFRGLPGGTTLYPGDPASLRLLAEMYEEFLPLFEADDFNVCCDETWELGRGRSRHRAERIGVGRVYLEFLKKIRRLCQKHGKRMNAWADIVLDHAELLGDVPKDIVMLNWDYHPTGSRIPRTGEIMAAGLPTVVCPGTNAWNSHGCRLEMGMKNIARFAAEGLKCGAEGLLNTDWGDGGHRNMLAVSLHNHAYGAAHSWCHRGVHDKRFTERFCRHTFGIDEAPFAEAIRGLGRADETLGLGYSNGGVLYHIFVGRLGSFVKNNDGLAEQLATIRPAAVDAYSRTLASLRWPRPGSFRDPFLRTALEEYVLATRLDAYSCVRLSILKAMAAGEPLSPADWRACADAARRVARHLERVWHMGNKPSRLRDQLKGLRQSAAEYGRLARR